MIGKKHCVKYELYLGVFKVLQAGITQVIVNTLQIVLAKSSTGHENNGHLRTTLHNDQVSVRIKSPGEQSKLTEDLLRHVLQVQEAILSLVLAIHLLNSGAEGGHVAPLHQQEEGLVLV